MANKAVFFDRDGVLNVDIHYLYRSADFVWQEDAIEALQYCRQQGYLLIVITNQSGVARGYYTEEDVRRLHAWMNGQLRAYGVQIDAFYYCPHHPQGKVAPYNVVCSCRKPAAGMVEAACAAYNVDKGASLLIGDSESDMLCADAAGIRGVKYQGGSLLRLVQGSLPSSE